jgi:hypothetical protein
MELHRLTIFDPECCVFQFKRVVLILVNNFSFEEYEINNCKYFDKEFQCSIYFNSRKKFC